MAKDHGPSVKNDKQYEGLRKKGMSKSRAAAIANAEGSSSRGGKSSGSTQQEEQRQRQRRQHGAEEEGRPQGRQGRELELARVRAAARRAAPSPGERPRTGPRSAGP